MDEFQRIFEIIESRSGIRVNESHRNYVIDTIKKRKAFSSPDDYASFLEQDENECSELIDLTAINETYFFREEMQFDFLKENVFPSFIDKPLVIWSAASSSGEESVSLYTLAKSLGCKPIVFATDIDSKTISEIGKFRWYKSSFRSDGQKYKPILEKFGTIENGYWTLKKSESSNFHISRFNLISDDPLPMPEGTVDIIFLRNVFIYFSRENQKTALKRMWDALKPGGLLFLSINEIASVDGFDEIPFEKDHTGSIYYLRKLTEIEFKRKSESKLLAKKITVSPTLATTKRQLSTTAVQKKQPESREDNATKAATKTTQTTIEKPKAEPQKQIPKKTKSIEEIAEEFLRHLSQKEYEKAKETLESQNFKAQHIEYKFYLMGRLYNSMGDTKNEQTILNKAVIANPKFWPAWFSLGVLYERTKQTAKKEESFKRCKEILENCIRENKTEYNFIVESFDLSYFVNLCDYYLGN